MSGRPQHGEGQALALRWGAFFIVSRGPVPRERWIARAMARDRPSPYDERKAYFHRSAGACPPRCPSSRCVFLSVVCARLITNRSRSLGNMPELQAILPYRAWHTDAGEGQALALRRKKEGVIFTVARGPVPRERWIARTLARDRPSPYDEGDFCRRAALLHRDQEVSPTRKALIYETP